MNRVCNRKYGFKEYALNPKNRGPLKHFNGHSCKTGNCGETLEFWVMVSNGFVKKVSFDTNGCASAVSCGSVMTEFGKSISVEDAFDLDPDALISMINGIPEEAEHCASPAIGVFAAAIENYLVQPGV